MAKETLKAASCLITIGGSAGSLDVLLHILPQWAPMPEMAVVIVLHRLDDNSTLLTDLLQARCKWTVKEAEDKESVLPGFIYIAPAGYHLLIEKDHTMSLDFSEKINYSRPSIDITFETASAAFQDRCLCVLLSGANADGVEGLKKAQLERSKIAVQHPNSAVVPFMPQAALNALDADKILSKDEMIVYFNQVFI